MAVFPGASKNIFMHYSVDKGELGHGQWATVRSCTCRRTKERFACKSICKIGLAAEEIEGIRSEVQAMVDVSERNSNVVKIRELFEDKFFVHIIMELCAGGELFARIAEKPGLTDRQCANVFRQVTSSLSACHTAGWMHRDLKPENILIVTSQTLDRTAEKESQENESQENESQENESQSVQNLEVRLADFGLAVKVKDGRSVQGIAGSPSYMAPEVVAGGLYGQCADMWSLGIVLHAMLTGTLPFGGKTTADIFRAVKKGKYDVSGSHWSNVSKSARQLVQSLLCTDPAKRPTAEQVLSHPWLQ